MAKKQLKIDGDELKALEVKCVKCGTSVLFTMKNGFRNGGPPITCPNCSSMYSAPLMTALEAYGQFRLACKESGSEFAFIVDAD